MTHQGAGYPREPVKNGREAADRLRETADAATDQQLKGVADRAQELASDVSQQVRDYGEKAQDAARKFKPFVEKSLKEQPMTTLAAAAVIGLVLGALWKK